MILIVGAGAIGSLWAAALRTTNGEGSVAFLSTRSLHNGVDNESRTRANGALIDFSLTAHSPSSLSGDYCIPLYRFDEIREVDLLLVCTKSYDASCVVKSLESKLNRKSSVVLFQNGLGSQSNILLEHGENFALFAAVTTEAVNRPKHGFVIHAAEGLTHIGALNQRASTSFHQTQLQQLLLPTPLKTELDQDIWRRLWHKLAINCAINPFTALLDEPNGSVRNSPLFLTHWPALREELVQALRLAGFEIEPGALDQLVYSVMNQTAGNISSMLQDVRRNKPTEIHDINGYVCRYLNEHDTDAPTNAHLVNCVNELQP